MERLLLSTASFAGKAGTILLFNMTPRDGYWIIKMFTQVDPELLSELVGARIFVSQNFRESVKCPRAQLPVLAMTT